jgi:ubiquinone/menaquinone biosynthesis C-methylase UbiE
VADAFKAFEAQAWARRAATYDLVTGAVTARLAGPLLDAAGVRAGTRMLDVGCGTGVLSVAAAARGAAPLGADLAEGMLALARRRHPDLEFVHADAEALPVGDGAFGAVVAGCVLNHLPAPERALAEWARVLAPGGRVALTVWERPARNRLLGELTDAVADAGVATRAALPPGPDPYRFADDEPLRAVLHDAGFADVEVRTLEVVHRAGGAGELWDGLLGGSARVSTAIAAQPPAVQARIRAAFERRIADHAVAGGGVALAAVVRLAAGRRP